MAHSLVAFDEPQKKAILLAIARFTVDRPVWDSLYRQVARALGGEKLYDDFKELREEELAEATVKVKAAS